MTIRIQQRLDYDLHAPGHIEIRRHQAFGQMTLVFQTQDNDEAHVVLDLESTIKVLDQMDDPTPSALLQGERIAEALSDKTLGIGAYDRDPKPWVNTLASLAVGLVLGLAIAQILPSPARAADVHLVPPEPYLTWARDMVRTGEGPGWVLLDQRKLQRACLVRHVVWGCRVDLEGLSVIYVLRDLDHRKREQTLVHEYAHELGWSH